MSLGSTLPLNILLCCAPAIYGMSDSVSKPALYEIDEAKILMPNCPLAAGSMQVVPKDVVTNFSDWQDISHLGTYDLIQRIVKIWETSGITNYLIFGKDTPEKNDQFNWEVVPYADRGSSFWKQFSVLKNIIFGGTCLSEIEYEKSFQKNQELFSVPLAVESEKVKEVVQGNDAFCNQEVIDRQRIWEGKEVSILYNYAPIVLSDEKLHFLIVSKKHREKFSDLTSEEYLEAMQLAQQLMRHYQSKGLEIAYLFNKNGKAAGQSVPHWHLHVVFAETKVQEFFAQLTVLKNMMLGSSAMSKEELDTKVKNLRAEMENVFRE